MFEVDLVHDAGARRHHLEIVERLLAPAQERVTLLVALELYFDVLFQCGCRAIGIHLYRVVDDQFGRGQRVDLGGIATELDHGVTHRGQVDDTGYASEILQHHAGRHESDFGRRFGLGIPLGDGLDLAGSDIDAVFVAEQVFQQDLQRVGEALEVELLAQLGQTGEHMLLAVDLEGVAYGKGIFHGECSWLILRPGWLGRAASA
jgi:hypothetical protein